MVLQMLQLADGRMVVTTAGNVNIYDGYQFSYIHKKDNYYYPLPDYLGYYHLYIDKAGRLWVKDWQKLLCMDVRKMSYTKDIRVFFGSLGVRDKVLDFFVDSEKDIWLVTTRGILNLKQKRYYQSLKNAGRLLDIDVDRDRAYLFWKNGEVGCYDMKDQKLIYRRAAYKQDEQGAFGNTSMVVKGPHGIFYQLRTGTLSGLFSFDTRLRIWKKLLVKDYLFHTLVVTRQNTAYISCANGYWSINLNNKTYTYNKALRLTDNSMLQTGLNTMCLDRQGGLWMGTYSRGILYSSPYRSGFSSVQDINVGVMKNRQEYLGKKYNTVYKDSRGWTWCGTNDGLLLFAGGKRHIYYTEDGLCNNLIHSVIEDRQHHIWIGTSYGISKITIGKRPSEIAFTNYQHEDGIQKHDYTDGMATLLKDGRIAMKGLDGWTVFRPEDIKPLRITLNPILLNTFVHGKNISVDDCKKLDYTQNTLSFDFSALNYVSPSQTYYRYRLNDGPWHVVSASEQGGVVDKKGILHLSFVEMTPDFYSLQVMASTNNKEWKGGTTTVSFYIRAPWWRSTVAYIVYLILVLASVSFGIITYTKRMRRKLQTKHRDELLQMRGEMEFVSRVTAYVEQNIANPKYSVEQLSRDMCMDRTGLYKKLTALMEKSPNVFIRDIRLDRAAELIHKGDMNIGSIAEQVGFSSPSYLSKCFQEKFGCRPSAYK
jgi:AraC-like DNA-binding protein